MKAIEQSLICDDGDDFSVAIWEACEFQEEIVTLDCKIKTAEDVLLTIMRYYTLRIRHPPSKRSI